MGILEKQALENFKINTRLLSEGMRHHRRSRDSLVEANFSIMDLIVFVYGEPYITLAGPHFLEFIKLIN